MTKKFRYPRTTLEVSDAFLKTITEGLGMQLLSDYPALTCYNGRTMSDGSGGCFAIYYVKSFFNASYPKIHSNSIDARMVIIRWEPHCRLASLWCTAWFRTGVGRFVGVPPDKYEPEIHKKHFGIVREYHPEIREFNPEEEFTGFDMIRGDLPPHPIRF